MNGSVAANKAYVIFAKKMNKTGLLASFNAALRAMKMDGSYDELVDTSMKTYMADPQQTEEESGPARGSR